MKRVALSTVLVLAIPLAACSSDPKGPNPLTGGTDSPTPEVSNLLTRPDSGEGWQIDGAHYVGINEETGDIVVKRNDEIKAFGSWGDTVDMTFTSIDPTTGNIGWETKYTVPYSFVEIDWLPLPPMPSDITPAQVGTNVNTAGGAPGPLAGPGSGVIFEFDGSFFDVTTGEFLDPPAGGASGTPYLTRYMNWSHEQLVVGDEDFGVLGEFDTTVTTDGVLILNDDLYFLGGSFTLRPGETEAQDFTITFLDVQSMETTEVDMAKEWYPQPTDAGTWGDFENNLQIVPLADGILWNIGGEEWLAITPDGVQESISLPDNVRFQGEAVGGNHATIDATLAVAADVSGSELQTVIVPTEDILVFTQDGTVLSWSEQGGQNRSGDVDVYLYDPDSQTASFRVGPNGDWVIQESKLVDTDGGDSMTQMPGLTFLGRTANYDVFSNALHAFEAGSSEMGTIIGVPLD